MPGENDAQWQVDHRIARENGQKADDAETAKTVEAESGELPQRQRRYPDDPGMI